jgi:hypothetical protein
MANFDYNQNDSTAPDYIKNRPFYKVSETVFDEDVTTVLNGDTDGSTCYIHSTTAFKDLADGDCLDVIYDGSEYTLYVKVTEDEYGAVKYIGNVNVYGTQMFEAQFSQYFANIEEFVEQNPSFAWLFVDTGEPFMIQIFDEGAKFITEEPGTYHFTIDKITDIKKLPSYFIDWAGGNAPSSLPEVTSDDNSKVLKVVNGVWAAGSINLESEVTE